MYVHVAVRLSIFMTHRCNNNLMLLVPLSLLLHHRMEAAMERDRLLALQKEQAKEEEKQRFVPTLLALFCI